MDQGWAIVVDIGKTLSKLSLWSREGRMLNKVVRRNQTVGGDAYQTLDTADVAEWLLDSLSRYAPHPVEVIVPVAHGAAVAGVHDDRLSILPPDYEWALPEQQLDHYRARRDSFAVTGSPALPAGLNLGAQLHYLERLDPGAFRRATLMPYAQYWAWWLTGEASSEVTSLGCHTDLWAPGAHDFSPMCRYRGWSDRFAPLAEAGDVIGTIRGDIAERTGLSRQVKVLAGLHDSNAALLAARGFAGIDGKEVTVLSTGTWFVAMRSTLRSIDIAALPEGRDCLVNVDAHGAEVPSARFMGGREIETLIELDTRQVDLEPDQPQLLAAVSAIVARRTMILPTLAPGNGPFPNAAGGWIRRPEDWHARRAAACLYAALVADVSLDLIGADQRLLVEGRFAEAEVFVRAVAALRPATEVFAVNAQNDVGFGALRLAAPNLEPDAELRRVVPLECDLARYREAWAAAIEQQVAQF